MSERSAAKCEKEARLAELAGMFVDAVVWWQAAAAAEARALAVAVEAGQWASQAAYGRYAARTRRRIRGYERHERDAADAADVIARWQARTQGLRFWRTPGRSAASPRTRASK